MDDRLEQIDAMRQGVAYGFQLKIRGFSVRARPLSLMESIDVESKVNERLLAAPKTAVNTMTQANFRAKETLLLCTTSDVGGNDPMLTEYLMDRMTLDEVTALFSQYLHGCERCNPALEQLSAAQVVELASSLKKNTTTLDELVSQLIELSTLQLVNLAAFLLKTKDD